jgi:LPXTG-site transpeptidase (sortase) family protein
MYRRSNAPNGVLRLLGGIIIIIGAVVAFTLYQRSDSARPPLITPTPLPTAAPTAVAALPQPTPSATPEVRMRIVSPKASLSTAITRLYFTTEGENWDLTYLHNFAGHLEGTAELGMGGNFVLAGHVELGDGEPGPFKYIGNLKKGDEIMVYSETPEKPFVVRYKVTEVKEVDPTEISVIRNHGYEELTLITCDDWDQETGEYLTRVIVHARPY